MNLRFLLSVILGLALYSFHSCTESTPIGGNLFPTDDDLKTFITDTFTIEAHTVSDGEIFEKGGLGNVGVFSTNNRFTLLGSMEEPAFGRSTASIFTEIRLPTNDVNLGGTGGVRLELDSLVLVLDYAAFYGDKLAPQSVKVYRLNERMIGGRSYHSKTTFDYEPVPVGEKLYFVPRPDDSVTVWEDTLPPQLRIRLDESLGLELLGKSGKSEFSDDDAFIDYFNGLYICADTVENGFSKGIMLFDLLSVFSKVELYYRKISKNFDVQDSLRVDFPISGQSIIVNRFTQNYRGSMAGFRLNNPDPIKDSVLFVQSMGGLKSKISIPHLKELGSDISINKAELIFTATGGSQSEERFTPPGRMYLVQADSSGVNNSYFIISRSDEIYLSVRDQLEGDDHYGGNQKTVTNSSGQEKIQYSFNMARQIQAIINEDVSNSGFFLINFPFFRTANRVMLGSPTHPDPDFKMNLYLTYTLIN